MTDNEKRAMNIAINAGHILLENGAEISRVEETMADGGYRFGYYSGFKPTAQETCL